MTSRKGREHVAAEISKETKEAMKESDEPMWKQIDDAVRMMKGLDEASTEEAFERRISRLVQRKKNVQSQIEDLQSEHESILQDIEHEERRRREFLAERDSINEIQDEILDELASSTVSVYAFRSDLRDLARREYGHETTENIQKAITDLKERRRERDLDISDTQFTENVNSQATGTADGGTSFKATSGEDDD